MMNVLNVKGNGVFNFGVLSENDFVSETNTKQGGTTLECFERVMSDLKRLQEEGVLTHTTQAVLTDIKQDFEVFCVSNTVKDLVDDDVIEDDDDDIIEEDDDVIEDDVIEDVIVQPTIIEEEVAAYAPKPIVIEPKTVTPTPKVSNPNPSRTYSRGNVFSHPRYGRVINADIFNGRVIKGRLFNDTYLVSNLCLLEDKGFDRDVAKHYISLFLAFGFERQADRHGLVTLVKTRTHESLTDAPSKTPVGTVVCIGCVDGEFQTIVERL